MNFDLEEELVRSSEETDGNESTEVKSSLEEKNKVC